VNGFTKRQLATFLLAVPALVGIFVLAGSAGATPTVSSKRADAQQAMAQINQMDQQLEKVGTAWEGARYHLNQTNAKLKATRISLGLARKSFGAARHALAQRVISVYMEQNDTSDSTVAILFQATSLQDMINRVDARQRISDHDTRVVKQVKTLRDKTAAEAASLQKMQAKQQAYLNQVTAQRSELQRKLSERQAYVRSVRREIASLVAEQQRQAKAAAARARRTIASYKSPISTSSPTAPTGHKSPISTSSPTAPTGHKSPISTSSHTAPTGHKSPTSTSSHTAPTASSVGAAVVNAAMSRLGDPYVWGAAGPTTFDCSGLVVWSFAQVHISLPHYSYSQMAMGSPVSYSDLQPGDLVFFYGGSHVGIYIGNGQFIHAPHTGTVVQVTSLSSYSLTAARHIG
jgi:cell wall-associated NlpC family hydrolase